MRAIIAKTRKSVGVAVDLAVIDAHRTLLAAVLLCNNGWFLLTGCWCTTAYFSKYFSADQFSWYSWPLPAAL